MLINAYQNLIEEKDHLNENSVESEVEYTEVSNRILKLEENIKLMSFENKILQSRLRS